MSRTPVLPAELPWQRADLLSWPDTVLAGGRRWSRTIRLDDGGDGIIEIRDPEGRVIHRGSNDACADTRVRIDIAAWHARGRISAPDAKNGAPE